MQDIETIEEPNDLCNDIGYKRNDFAPCSVNCDPLIRFMIDNPNAIKLIAKFIYTTHDVPDYEDDCDDEYDCE